MHQINEWFITSPVVSAPAWSVTGRPGQLPGVGDPKRLFEQDFCKIGLSVAIKELVFRHHRHGFRRHQYRNVPPLC